MEDKPVVKKVVFKEFNNVNNDVHIAKVNNIDILKELDADLTVEFASRKIKFGEVLNFKVGEVIPLNKQLNEQLRILINGAEIAKGEVVVMEDEFGIRITEIKKAKKE